jgi:hypothetical protein
MTGDADASGLPWLRFGGRRGGNTRGGLLAGEFLLAVPGAESHERRSRRRDKPSGFGACLKPTRFPNGSST